MRMIDGKDSARKRSAVRRGVSFISARSRTTSFMRKSITVSLHCSGEDAPCPSPAFGSVDERG
ncbi:MAG: hypothetical protein B7Z13_13270 [Caulobacterales bacterium 32-67-6]|nr:MAG: hypothetical protein B7Z13_13270 [Caulobacterales bacterium 32-67-6]